MKKTISIRIARKFFFRFFLLGYRSQDAFGYKTQEELRKLDKKKQKLIEELEHVDRMRARLLNINVTRSTMKSTVDPSVVCFLLLHCNYQIVIKISMPPSITLSFQHYVSEISDENLG